MKIINLIYPVFILIFSILFLRCNSYKSSSDVTKVEVSEGTNMAAALSPDQTTLVIELQGALWTIPADGGTAIKISDRLDDCQGPVWSPDGNSIAFYSYQDGNYHIWTIDKNGLELKQITEGNFDDREPDWSPDGKTIIFSSDRSGNYDIWQVALADLKPQQLTFNVANDYNPAFSSNGEKIAFVSDRDSSGIYVIENGIEKMAIRANNFRLVAPSWSPNDSLLIYTAYKSKSMLFDPSNTSWIYVADLFSDSVKLVSKGEEDVFPFKINWIDNNSIIYTADGLIKKRVITNKEVDVIQFKAKFELERKNYIRKHYDFDDFKERPVLGIAGPVISPDGKRIAFSALGNIYIQDIDGELSRVTKGSFVNLYPDWSPDGKSFTYISDSNGKMEIWIHNISNGNSQLLTDKVHDDVSMPSWSPDGKKIAFFTSNYMKRWGRGLLHVADVATGNVKIVSDKSFFVPSKPSWSNDCKTLAFMTVRSSSSRFREGHNNFNLISIADGTSRFVTPDSTSPLSIRSQNGPVWSPNGKYMAYVDRGLLWVVSVREDGSIIGKPRKLTSELADNLSWTGDSKSIAYIATNRLKLIDIQTQKVRNIKIDLNWKPHHETEEYILHVGKLFNGIDSNYIKNVDILVSKNRIKKISPHKNHEEGMKVVDIGDKVIIPGLFEMHTHLSSEDGRKLGKLWLSYGITSVRETGADPYEALERKESWLSGSRPGPRDFFTGGLNDGNRIYYGLANSVTDTSHLRMELYRAKELGYSLIKTYVRFPDSLQKVLTIGAHNLGIPVASHELYPAVMNNVDGLEHIAGTSRRGFSMILDANFRSYEDVVKLISYSGMSVTPTLTLRSGFFRMATKYDQLLNDERMRRFVPYNDLKNLYASKSRQEAINTSKSDENYKALLKTAKAIFDSGGKIVAGTDAPFAPYGASLHTELWILVEAGLKPYQALQCATIRAAETVGVSADLGSVEPGKLADLIIVDGDPLDKIQDAMNVKAVIVNGTIHQMSELLR